MDLSDLHNLHLKKHVDVFWICSKSKSKPCPLWHWTQATWYMWVPYILGVPPYLASCHGFFWTLQAVCIQPCDVFSHQKYRFGRITHQELLFTILNGIRMIYNLRYRSYFIPFITIKGHNCTIHPIRNRCALRGHWRSHGKVDLPPTSCEGVESLGTQLVIRYGDESWDEHQKWWVQ